MKTDKFRAWLAKRLLGSPYATIAMPDAQIDAVAKRLGVDPDLLVEVRAQARLDLHERGLARPLSNRQSHREALIRAQNDRTLYQLTVWLPPDIQAAWKQECERRCVEGTVLLRSLVHSYLLGSREPNPAPRWVLDGRLIPEDRERKGREKAVISHGAKRALHRRAASRNTKSMYNVRALMMEALRGEHVGIPLVTAGMMYEDETRYNLGENARP